MTSATLPRLPSTAALFLDFDGTLVSIAPRPQDVRVPRWVRPTLEALERRLGGALAIVSGRPIVQLDAFLAPLRLVAAGAHGAEWRDSAGQLHGTATPPPPRLVAAAKALVAAHVGLLFEPKPTGFSLHYRARPELEAECRDLLARTLATEAGDAETWECLHGQCVVELKPRAFSKGTAVTALLREPAFAGRLPIFIGDDRTDEDGIEAVQAAGGFGVRVGPGRTNARYRLNDTSAVGRWLAAGCAARDAAEFEIHTS
jgi:trehalose 6-phosphate phosphatase